MNRWKISYADGSDNIALSERDIWTGLPNVMSVNDMGPDIQQSITLPIILSKTAFNKYAAHVLGGMDVFQNIMDACEASTGSVKFCFTQYESAQTFEKSEVAAFTQIMVGGGKMTDDQRDALLDGWPTA